MRFIIIAMLACCAVRVYAAESKRDKDVRVCGAEADAAVATTKLKHPADVMKIKRDAFAACLAARNHPGGKIRGK